MSYQNFVGPLKGKNKEVIDEKFIDIHNNIESNPSLKRRKPYEIAFFSSIFHYGEELQKDFECYAESEDGTLQKGELIITDERIMFFKNNSGNFEFLHFEYFEMEDFFQSSLKDKSNGSLHVIMDEEEYVFSGFMRFGLSIWVDYVLERMAEI